MLACLTSSLSLVHDVIKIPTPQSARAMHVGMKAEIVLADKEVEAKIMAVVNAEPKNTKGAALCSLVFQENFKRIKMDEEEGGCSPQGPPLTKPTGKCWPGRMLRLNMPSHRN